MLLRANPLAVLLAAILAPTAWAQSVEGDDSESVQTAETVTISAESIDSTAVAQLIVEKTNELRVANQRSKVEADPELSAAARYFADYMAQHDRYGHTADGSRPAARATKFGYEYCLVSENIAYQYSSTGFALPELAERFVEAWKNSPGHRANMLDPDVSDTGVAVARSDKTDYWYAVQMFGRPASAAVEFSITNRADAPIEYTIADQTFLLPPRYTRTHTRCRTPRVSFELPGEQSTPSKIEPTSGDHYDIVREDGRIAIHKE
jgi:uncharacterized protein YkwD